MSKLKLKFKLKYVTVQVNTVMTVMGMSGVKHMSTPRVVMINIFIYPQMSCSAWRHLGCHTCLFNAVLVH